MTVASGCGDDGAQVPSVCDATQPVHIADLGAGIGDYVRVTPVDDRLYINVYRFEGANSPQPGRVNQPTVFGAIVGGQTWITGSCGESAVLIGEGEFLGLTPAFFGEAADPTLACDYRGNDKSRIYRIDPTGAAAPTLLLEHWSCPIDAARPVTARRDDDTHELWFVPGFPDLTDAVLLAEDVQDEVGHDVARNYYIGGDQALHAVDLQGHDEILGTDVLTAVGGATGSPSLFDEIGPARLLWAAMDDDGVETVHLYRGESDDIVKIADRAATDWSEAPGSAWAWNFDFTRTRIVRWPFAEAGPYVAVYDLDGATSTFPAGVHGALPHFAFDGVVGDMDGPQGRHWVFAPFDAVDAIPLDLPWEDPDILIYVMGWEELYYYDDGRDRIYRVPFDGSPAVEVPDYGYQYGDDDMITVHNGRLFHVNPRTGASTVVQDDVGAMGLAGTYKDGEFVSQGVFYTDVSSREAPSLWFMPTALLPGGS